MNTLLPDDELTRLLGAAADTFAVPERGAHDVLVTAQQPRSWRRSRAEHVDDAAALVLEEADGPVVRRRRRLPAGRTAAAVLATAAVVAGAFVLGGQTGSGESSETVASAPAPAASAASAVGAQRSAGTLSGPEAAPRAGALADVVAGSSTPANDAAPTGLSNLQLGYDPDAASINGVLPAQSARGPAATSIGLPAATSPGAPAATDPDAPKIVKTGTLTLQGAKGAVPTVIGQVNRVVTTLGGYQSNGTTSEVGDNPTGTMTYRLPVAQFENAVSQLRALKQTVLSESETGRDVTAQYADTSAQITSLSRARDRYLVILGQAKTIGEILSVQQRVDTVQGQIDQLTGQQKVLADQSSLATLTVTVSEKPLAGAPVPKPRSGLSQAWHDAGHGFTSGVEALVRRSGRALLVLIILALLVAVGRPSWKLARRRFV